MKMSDISYIHELLSWKTKGLNNQISEFWVLSSNTDTSGTQQKELENISEMFSQSWKLGIVLKEVSQMGGLENRRRWLCFQNSNLLFYC